MKNKTTANHWTIDIEALLKHFGGPKALIKTLKEHKIAHPAIDAIYKWNVRNSCRGTMIATLFALARKMGKKLDFYDFIVPPPIPIVAKRKSPKKPKSKK